MRVTTDERWDFPFIQAGLGWGEIFSDISDTCPYLKVWIPSGFDFYLLPSWLHLTFPFDSNFKAIMCVLVSSPKYHENWKLWDLKSKTRTTWTWIQANLSTVATGSFSFETGF